MNRKQKTSPVRAQYYSVKGISLESLVIPRKKTAEGVTKGFYSLENVGIAWRNPAMPILFPGQPNNSDEGSMDEACLLDREPFKKAAGIRFPCCQQELTKPGGVCFGKHLTYTSDIIIIN